MTFSFEQLRKANKTRIPIYKKKNGDLCHTEPDGSDWEPAQWLQALIGELGEYANLRKKFERGDLSFDEYEVAAAKEMADIQTYLDILSMRCLDTTKVIHPYGVDLGEATRAKFNEVSHRLNIDVFLKSNGDVISNSGTLDKLKGL